MPIGQRGTQQTSILEKLAACLAHYLATSLLTRDPPLFYLDNLHVSSQNETLTFATTTIQYDLRIQNKNYLVGFYFNEPVSLTVTYVPPTETKKNVTIGKHTISGFYQGLSQVKYVRGLVVVKDVFSKAATNREPAKVAVLKVDFDGRLKFRSIEGNKLDMVAGAVVEVNCNTGNIVQNKTIQLKYTSGPNRWGFLQWLLLLPLVIFFGAIFYGVLFGSIVVLSFIFFYFLYRFVYPTMSRVTSTVDKWIRLVRSL